MYGFRRRRVEVGCVGVVRMGGVRVDLSEIYVCLYGDVE